MDNQREQDALKAYLTLCHSKGVPETTLVQREFIILRLMNYISHIPLEGKQYRAAVDKFFSNLDEAEWAICIPVIRGFYSFWVKDIKAIAAMNQDHEFEPEHKEWQPETKDLKNIWDSLDRTSLTMNEVMPLQQYEVSLREKGCDDLFVDTRKKLAKMLLLRLRDVPHKQPNAYRKVIDANLKLFTTSETHQTFLKVARDFYAFWRGDVSFQTADSMAVAA
jgi:hypothetical protein